MMDRGDIRFDVAPERGVMLVTVRPPLGLENSAVSAELSILDFLDIAADTIKGLNDLQRDAMRRFAQAAGANTVGKA